MHHISRTLLLISLASGLLSCCGQTVGYEGPLPSSQMRRALPDLWGRSLPAGSVAFCNQELTLVSFLVGPHGPVVIVEEPGAAGDHATTRRREHRIPVLTDGDIGDLYKRVTSEALRLPDASRDSGEQAVFELSDAYRRMMTGK